MTTLDAPALIARLVEYQAWSARLGNGRPNEAERVWAVKLLKDATLALMQERVRLAGFAPGYHGLPENGNRS